MADRTVTVSGVTYSIGTLAARPSFHVARRIAPLLANLSEAAASVFKKIKPNASEASEDVDLSPLAGPLAEALADMKEEDCDYVIDACLKVCKRQQGNSFFPVVNAGGHIMYSDIDMATMMRLTVSVIQSSLGSFFPIAQPEAVTASSAK